jgi:uncharacterized protein YndB with AHSA1/START domain
MNAGGVSGEPRVSHAPFFLASSARLRASHLLVHGRRMSGEERVSVQVARRFDVSPRRIFDVWTDPRNVRGWLATPPLSAEVIELELKARQGRRFSLIVRRQGRDGTYAGEWIDVVAGQRLVFTWVDADVSKETTLVTVGFHPIPSAWAATELRIEHTRVLPHESSRAQARWTAALDALAAFVGRSPGAR